MSNIYLMVYVVGNDLNLVPTIEARLHAQLLSK
jgi:hypothetical protein